jgi:hypothetical protein
MLVITCYTHTHTHAHTHTPTNTHKHTFINTHTHTLTHTNTHFTAHFPHCEKLAGDAQSIIGGKEGINILGCTHT